MKLLVATTNKGKIREIKRLLEGLPVEIFHTGDPGYENIVEAPEDQDTFEGNAIQKAMHYGDISGLPTVAEDAGLTIPSLDGWPGVKSARVADSDDERISLVLKKLSELEDEDREAAFVSVVAFYNPEDGLTETFPGFCSGQILHDPQGVNGFGYDPIFFHPGFGTSLAELSTEEKNEISHRGQSFRAFAGWLREHLTDKP